MFSLTKSHNCPDCGSSQIHRSRRKGLWEFLLHNIFFITPYRCKGCDARFFRFRLYRSPFKKPRQHPASSIR